MTYLLSKNYEDKIPTVLQDPYIDGLAEVGRTLTCRHFALGATSVTYQWYLHPTEVLPPTAEIFDATSQSIAISSNYLSNRLICRVTFTNDQGSVVRYSTYSAEVVAGTTPTDPEAPDPVAPSFNNSPTISGVAEVGRTLTLSADVSNASAIAYQWYRDIDGEGATAATLIPNATLQTYVLSAGDEGYHIIGKVIASNTADTVEEWSLYTAAVAAASNEIPVGAIAIDEAWLAATVNGGPSGPWVLNKSGGYYYMTTDVLDATATSCFRIANDNITLDMNGHTLISLGGYAVRLWIYGWADGGTLPVGNTGGFNSSGAVNVTIKNGTLINNRTLSASHGVSGRRSKNTVISNMTIVSGTGGDSHAINYENGDTPNAPQVVDSVLYSRAKSTANRHTLPACIDASECVIYAARNAIIGDNSGIHCGWSSLVEKNFISHNCFDTNGWGVVNYAGSGVVVQDNVVLPYNGRGIYFDSDPARNGIARNNVVLALECRNGEFGDKLNPSPFKIRYSSSGHQIYDNNCLSIGGRRTGQASTPTWVDDGYETYYSNDPRLCMASGAYHLSYGNANLPQTDITGNTFRAITYGDIANTDQRTYAACIALEGPGGITSSPYGNVRDTIRRNVCKSNCYMIAHQGDDGWARLAMPMDENEFYWQTGAEAYAEFTAAVDAKLATLGLNAACLAAATARKNRVFARINTLINQSDTNLRTERRFWRGDYYGWASTNIDFATIRDSILADGSHPNGAVDPTTWGRPDSPITFHKIALRVAKTHTLRIFQGPVPATYATVAVTPDQIDTPIDDVMVTTTGDDGTCTITYFDAALSRESGGSQPVATAGTSSTIAVYADAEMTSLIGSRSVLHSALGESLDIWGS